MANLTISPNGKYLAVTMPNRGRMNLSIVDLEARSAQALTGYQDFDVQGIVWIGNDRLLYSLGQNNSPTGPDAFDGGVLFVISRYGKETKRLSSTVRESRARGDAVFRGLSVFRRIPGNTDEIIASGNMTSADSTDLYRLNLNTGKYTLLQRHEARLTHLSLTKLELTANRGARGRDCRSRRHNKLRSAQGFPDINAAHCDVDCS